MTYTQFRRIDFEWTLAMGVYSNGEYLSRFMPYGVWTPIVFVYGPTPKTEA